MNIYIPKWLIKFVLIVVGIIVAIKILTPIGFILVLIGYIYIKTKCNSSKNNSNKEEC